MAPQDQQGGGRWSDLAVRIWSSVAMLAVGGLAIWQGGIPFYILVLGAVAVMVWELAGMLGADARRMWLSAAVAGCFALILWFGSLGALIAGPWLPPAYAFPLLLAPAILGCLAFDRDRWIFALYGLAVLNAGLLLGVLWVLGGPGVVLWFLAVIVATDVFGYFGGRLIGGPKFWPRVSPKKTWAGIIAGWVAAAVVGGIVGWMGMLDAPLALGLSVVLSFGSQMGDIAESAIKRRAGVKDSSSLIPGHGGFLDRFDGVIGAAALLTPAAFWFLADYLTQLGSA